MRPNKQICYSIALFHVSFYQHKNLINTVIRNCTGRRIHTSDLVIPAKNTKHWVAMLFRSGDSFRHPELKDAV